MLFMIRKLFKVFCILPSTSSGSPKNLTAYQLVCQTSALMYHTSVCLRLRWDLKTSNCQDAYSLLLRLVHSSYLFLYYTSLTASSSPMSYSSTVILLVHLICQYLIRLVHHDVNNTTVCHQICRISSGVLTFHSC